MGEWMSLAVTIGCLILPFVMMALLWRRMKRVRNKVYQEAKPVRAHVRFEESTRLDDGTIMTRADQVNSDLIEMGGKAREARWPLDNV